MRVCNGLIGLLVWICISVPVIVTAQETDSVSLEDMVVTASKVPKTLGNVTQKVAVIHAPEMDAIVSGNHNAAELLLYEPGVSVSVLSRNDANWGAIGGMSQKYNTFMLNGLPIDAFVDPQSLAPQALERIEIQRGPASVLYPNYMSMDFSGNQSPLTGTTNFILKERIDKLLTSVDAYYGSYNTLGGGFYHQQAAGNIHFFFGAGHETADYTNYGTDDSWLNMIDDPEYQKTKFYLNTTVFVGDRPDHKISLFAHQTNHSGDCGRPNRDFDHYYQTVNAAYALPLSEAVAANFKLGYRHYNRTWEDDNYPADLSLASENGVSQYIVPADLALSIQHGDDDLLTIGADYQAVSYQTWSETDSKSIGNDADATQYGLYVQEELMLNALVLRLGGRYTHMEHDIKRLGGVVPGNPDDSWDEFLWSTGARYALTPSLALYTNLGTSFVAPSLKSVGGTLAASDAGVAGQDGQLPNPDLSSESGMGFDVGADWEPLDHMKLGARFFCNFVDDQIVTVVVSETPSQSRDINAGDTTSYGMELELRQQLNDAVVGFANYTYTHSEVDNDVDPDQDGAQVAFVPEHMGNIGLDIQWPGDITASIYLHLAGKIYDSTSKSGRNEFSGYELLNASIQKPLVRTEAYRLNGYVDLYNITNNQFKMPWQFQDPGFSATVGIRLVL